MYFEFRIWRFRWTASFAYEAPECDDEPGDPPAIGFAMPARKMPDDWEIPPLHG